MRILPFALLVFAACATSAGGGNNTGDDAPDADPNAPDADPNAPDADPNAPDADPTAPDANPSSSCPTSPCDLHEQCGCNSTQACDIDFNDLMGTACRGIATPGDDNDTCTANNQCDAGYVCLGDASGRSCKEYCDAASDCDAPRGQCVIQLNDGTNDIPGAVVCSSNCDPAVTTNASCPSTWACDLFTATFETVDHDIADCRPVGTAVQGQTCSATVACAAGFTCVNTGSLVCARICKRPAGTECTGGTTCQDFTPVLTVGGQDYGVCL